MEILKFMESVIAVILFGLLQHLNIIKINNLYVRVIIGLLIFLHFDLRLCIILYAFGFDYALFVLYQYNTKGTGLNTFYPELNNPDRLPIWLIVKATKSTTVTFTMLFDYYIFCSVYILVCMLTLLIKQCL